MEFRDSYEKLLTPGKIGKMELKNRMIMPAMGTNLGNANNTVSDIQVAYYTRRGNGGIGMVITEVVAPEPEGRVIVGEMLLSDDKYMNQMSRIPHGVHSGGAKACLQLAHGGCYASERITGSRPKSPSSIATALLPDDHPREMTIEEIKELIDKYGKAAERGKRCGFDCVELHGAHGYMPLQFLSAYTNKRTDEYGGSLENRARFALETVAAIKKYTGKDYPLIYRLSAVEDVPDGVTLEEAREFAKMLEKAGVDAINVSMGTWDSRSFDYADAMEGKTDGKGKKLEEGVAISSWVPPHYSPKGTLIPLAKAIKEVVSIPVITVCSITPEMGEEALENGDADFVAFGRQSIADPDFPNKLYAGKPETIRRCLRCNECLNEVQDNCVVSCAVNPEAGKEHEIYIKSYPATVKKKVAVIGSGPAGIEAAITATERGHDVTLFEKEDRLGGQLHYIGIPDFKSDYRDYESYMINAVKNCGAKIVTGVEVTADMIVKEGFDVAIVATGASTFIPNIPGKDQDKIYDPLKVLDGDIPEGENVLVCGAGLVGSELALFLGNMGKKITIIDMLPDVAPDMTIYNKMVFNAELVQAGVVRKVNHRITELNAKSVKCLDENGNEVEFEGDAVICALGLKSRRTLLEDLRKVGNGLRVIPVGDANGPRKVMQATHEGYHAARII